MPSVKVYLDGAIIPGDTIISVLFNRDNTIFKRIITFENVHMRRSIWLQVLVTKTLLALPANYVAISPGG